MIKKIGRPREYTQEIADRVIADITCDKSYRDVAVEYGISLAMVQRIVAEDKSTQPASVVNVGGGDNGL